MNMYHDVIDGKKILSTGETALKVHEVYKSIGL